MIFRNQGSSIKKSNSISRDDLIDTYGLNSYEFTQKNKEEIFICSKSKDFDLIDGIHIEPPMPKVKEWSNIMSKLGKKLESGKLDSWTEMNMVFDTNEY